MAEEKDVVVETTDEATEAPEATPEVKEEKVAKKNTKKIIIAIAVTVLIAIIIALLYLFLHKVDFTFKYGSAGLDDSTVKITWNHALDKAQIKENIDDKGVDQEYWYRVDENDNFLDINGEIILKGETAYPFDFNTKIKEDYIIKYFSGMKSIVVGEDVIVEEETTVPDETTTEADDKDDDKNDVKTTAATNTATKPERKTAAAPTISLSVDKGAICGYAGGGVATVKETTTNADKVTWEVTSGSYHTWNESSKTLTAKKGQFDQYTVTITATATNAVGSASDSITVTIEPQLILRVIFEYTGGKRDDYITSDANYCSYLKDAIDHQVVVQAQNGITISSWDKSGLTIFSSGSNGYRFQSTGSSGTLRVTSQCGQSIFIDMTNIA